MTRTRWILIGCVAALLVALGVGAAGGRGILYQAIFHNTATGGADRTAYSKLADIVSVKDFGAVGDGVTDDTAAIQAAITACTTGKRLHFSGASYKITAALTVASSCEMHLGGATITQATSNTGGFIVTANGVSIVGPGSIVGPQFAASQSLERGISVNGTSAASPIVGFKAANLSISNWGQYGIYGTYVTDIEITRNSISNIFYAGSLWISAIRGVFSYNNIQNITGSITGSAYGVALTRNETASLVTDPPSSDIAVIGNVVKNVTIWECYDTHAGQRLVFANNVGRSCIIGIRVGPDNSNAIAPHAVQVIGNTLESDVTDGSAQYGIALSGYSNPTGTLIDGATGSIVGNAVSGYGNDATATGGAIYIHSTAGLNVSGNMVVNGSPNCIIAYHDNIGLSISGGTCVDAWTNAQANAVGIEVNSSNQSVGISGVSFSLNGKSATHVGSIAIHASNLATISVNIGENQNAYTTYTSLGASVVSSRVLDTAWTAATLPTQLTVGTVVINSNNVKAAFYDNLSSNPSGTGFVRLRSVDGVGWRNAGNSADILLSKNSRDALIWGGANGIAYTGSTFAALDASAVNGTHTYCSDCTIANPCASGGTGAFAKRLNGVWICN